MEWARRGGERDTVISCPSPAAFFTLLDELTIARSRNHIKKTIAAGCSIRLDVPQADANRSRCFRRST